MKPLLLKSLLSKLKNNISLAFREWDYERTWRSRFVEVTPATPQQYENAMYQEVVIMPPRSMQPLADPESKPPPPRRFNLVTKKL